MSEHTARETFDPDTEPEDKDCKEEGCGGTATENRCDKCGTYLSAVREGN